MYSKFKLSKKILFLALFCASLIIVYISFRKEINHYRYKLKYERFLKSINKIPDSFWEEKYKEMPIKSKYKVALLVYGGGEYSYAEFFKYAAEKKGWEVKIYYRVGHFYEQDILAFDPDFIILNNQEYFVEPKLKAHRSKKYLLSFAPMNQVLNMKIKFKSSDLQFFHIQNLLMHAHAVLTSVKEVGVFARVFENQNKNFNGLRILPLAPEMKNEPAEPRRIIWYGMFWEGDKRAENQNFTKFIKLINENVDIKVYGSYRNYQYLKKENYGGYMPSSLELLNAIRKNGIYLLTHSDAHIQSGVPSLRIFEATAANAVVISDKHPFAIEHFGDNFLYFDQNADAETMYKQVKAHYDWIKANPEKAKAMAARAHQIFLEKFTLEKDLVRIAKMHEYIVRQEKEMGLSYPLVY